MTVLDLIYLVVLCCIKFYKWIELQVLKLFHGSVYKKGRQIGEKYGIVFHANDKPIQKFTNKEEKQLLSKCKYNHLLNLRIGSKFFIRVANQGNLGIGEEFMNGDLAFTNSEKDITEFVYRLLDNNLNDLLYLPWNRFLMWLELSAFNLQTPAKISDSAKHYNFGNDLFEACLGPRMLYSCGYWANADNLDDAQTHKMDLIARKLDLKPGMRVLDIGCGWGMLCKYLAEKYEVSCVGVTISKEGMAYAQKICKGLDVQIRLHDYRQCDGDFDRIVCVGVLEHVGPWNLRTFFEVVDKCLKDDGIFLHETIGNNHKNIPPVDPWMHAYMYPNMSIPYYIDIAKATEGLFIIEDWHNFGWDYVKTIEAWRNNFVQNWPNIEMKYEDRFYRMWIYYLSVCIGIFQARRYQLWQVVLSKNGLQRDYRAAR